MRFLTVAFSAGNQPGEERQRLLTPSLRHQLIKLLSPRLTQNIHKHFLLKNCNENCESKKAIDLSPSSQNANYTKLSL